MELNGGQEIKHRTFCKMRFRKVRIMLCAVSGLVIYLIYIMHVRVGRSGIYALKEMMLLRNDDDNIIHFNKKQHLDVRHDHHDHREQNPFVLQDESPKARSFKNNKLGSNLTQQNDHNQHRNAVDNRVGFQAQLGDKLEPNFQLPASEKTVAIGVAVTTRGQWEPQFQPDKLATILPVFKGLLDSFCRTASYGFAYHFYVAHDKEDPFFSKNGSHHHFVNTFYVKAGEVCSNKINVSLHMVECLHTGHPAWAQNDAMMAAYMDNMAYYYRVNDDTVMETTGWTEKLIENLLRYDPPNVGVVGPWFKEGNIAILTHDFVHRTHLDIFGFYYPRVFTDWFADDWITGVYYPERLAKVPGVRVKHTMEFGNRYVVHFEKARRVAIEVEIGKLIVKRWLTRLRRKEKYDKAWDKQSKNVVSVSLYGSEMEFIYGALRYAQLVPILYPNWRVRAYISFYTGKSDALTPLDIIVKKLDNMGVEIIKLDEDTSKQVTPDMWKFLVADDTSVDRFIVRSTDTRPSEREAVALENWLKTENPFHCIRDHPRHSNHSLIPTLIGGMPNKLRSITGKSWRTLMRGYTLSSKFLEEVIWPQVKSSCYCHDSVSCDQWTGSVAFPVLRAENEFIGQRYDANDQLIDNEDSYLWGEKFIKPECVFIKNTGFEDEAVRAVIRRRPVLWSQDFHVTPIMDIKSLLLPIGVKIVDKSLSYYCGSVGTCAKNLRVINRENGFRLTPELIDQFYNTYKGDAEMKRVTAFVCTLPVAMCEAFVKFNKSMIIIATIRYEQARPEPEKWNKLNQLLLNVSQDPKGLVAANNLYDARYIEYFTGIKPLVIPNYCAYLQDTYDPKRKQFLMSPVHSTELYDDFFTEFDEVIMKKRVDLLLFPLRQLYPQYLFSDLAAHPGVVYIPYQISMSSLTEQYRLNIPLFFPTVDLLAKWHVQYSVVRQRTWMGYMQRKESKSHIKGVISDIPDPNNDLDEDAVKYWLKFADYYQWPHIIYYESVEDLVNKMVTIDLKEISKRMMEYNRKVKLNIKDTWSKILLKITEGKPMS